MARLEIRLEGDRVLRQRAREVRKVNAALRRLIDDMIETMRAAPGVGLAANQVGVLRRVIVVDDDEAPLALINPEILSSEGEAVGTEGCLSIPGVQGEVPRATRIHVKALDRDGREQHFVSQDFQARVIQHEVDHLDGILFTDRALSIEAIEVAVRDGAVASDDESGAGL